MNKSVIEIVGVGVMINIFKKKKKWIHIREMLYMCPNCRKRFNFDKRILWKCCPICEQKMNGVKEQNHE